MAVTILLGEVVNLLIKLHVSRFGEHHIDIIIIIIIILLKQYYMVQLANNKIQMAWLTSWLVVG